MQNPPDENPLNDRRPLTSRSTVWAVKLSAALAKRSITPNQISMLSMVFAAVALGALVLSVSVNARVLAGLWLIVAAIGCQLRLLCNLMDGMVAIEAGKKTLDGAFWNEFPDRVADVLILVGLGLAAGSVSLGWAAAALAVFTAYVRELGKGIDGVVDFQGPMAKPHRMALVTGALLIAAVCSFVSESLAHSVATILQVALWILCAGTILTLYRRSNTLLKRLQ
ncbi:CDP-alcohol phosphatidyltransferase family protein [Granulosicoccus antarcticus]|uniref:CDP-diacylglycerol--glycerol-3-phosphate 3-phosphatidyltransferase n=1 Tax=Granulosicoccus antarcticus IMCC3135 TaxID=1192854 RepID=A0A2Z2NID8_9GAMM|nr:CDP-alcohol phosphatidyltransferase family protein [Granulosicoccus antarcticus]ASJ71102.1 hypothetical protein IMCC3135_04945 [Granulosicoccus antarcticus IMCC3135]